MYFGEKVKLRALEMEDLDIIMKHFNNLELRQYLNSQTPISRHAEKQWLERATTQDPWRDGGMTLAIEDRESGEFLGTVSLFDISKQHKRAEFGIAIHKPDNLGKGYGTDTTRVMLWVAFHILGLNSVQLITISYNERAQKAYEKAGFKRNGVYRQGAYVQGAFHDYIIMDILKDEFFETYPPGTTVGKPS
ncbi:MAG: GNAT family N-acetyltransferase [Candidatus Thorarchaeota archaeon]|jgi:RimJ/RimL family protein N-acetyltransferase